MRKAYLEWALKSEARLDDTRRRIVNAQLRAKGFDGNKRFARIGEALNGISGVLDLNGIEPDAVFSADRFRPSEGRATFPIAFKTDDPFRPESIDNSLLVIQWAELAPNSIEVLSNLS